MSKVAPNTQQKQEKQQALIEKQKRPIDPRLSNGPIEERHCTDLICFVLFIASFVVMWWIAITGYTQGTPERLAAAYDPDSNPSAHSIP